MIIRDTFKPATINTIQLTNTPPYAEFYVVITRDSASLFDAIISTELPVIATFYNPLGMSLNVRLKYEGDLVKLVKKIHQGIDKHLLL